jgi:hypothetical protein
MENGMAAIISLKDQRLRPARPAMRGGQVKGTVLLFTGVWQEQRKAAEGNNEGDQAVVSGSVASGPVVGDTGSNA